MCLFLIDATLVDNLIEKQDLSMLNETMGYRPPAGDILSLSLVIINVIVPVKHVVAWAY